MRTPVKNFTCWECGNCCRIKGTVQLTDVDAERIATHLGLAAQAFTEQYTTLMPNRRGLQLRNGEGDACVFLKKDGACAIYEARPQQCRDFPYTWNYPGWEKECKNSCRIPA